MRKSIERKSIYAKCSRSREMLCFFSIIYVSVRSKNRFVKMAGAEVAAQSNQEKLHSIIVQSIFLSQNGTPI